MKEFYNKFNKKVYNIFR